MNDILPSINTVLKTNRKDVSEFSDGELRRAYMILRIQVLLNEIGRPVIIRGAAPAPSVEHPTLFCQLEPGATFLINGEGRYAGGDGQIELCLRPDELEEITRVYDAYLAAWRAEVDDLWRAFVFRNELFAAAGQSETMSREDELKARLMARALRRVRVPLGTKRRMT